jgi:Bacterial Ig-like domain (group 2).
MPKTKITYQSKNKKVATVNSKGVVRGIRKGKTTILVTANGKTVKVQITVK